MGKRLSANAPKPRSRFPFPGYPTVAAAGLYLCLSGGCSREPGFTDTTNAGGARDNTGGTTSTGGATSTGGSTSIVNTTDPGSNLAGGVSLPFEETPPPAPDAGTPDVLPPAPDAVPDVMAPPAIEDASEADLVPTETPLPPLGGGAPIPY
jgi:hypothetical protein